MSELPFKTLDSVETEGKRVLVRADLNCSIDPVTQQILDDSRIRATVPTLTELSSSRVVLMAHQGRPGSRDFISLEPHTEKLRDLGFNVKFVDDIFGEKAKAAIQSVKVGEILVLQNVRMFDGENKKGPIDEVAQEPIVQELYPFFDLFVNDAFGAAHRSQPSVVGFTKFLPSVAGRLLEKEIRILNKISSQELHPWILLLGGSKVSDKVNIMAQLLKTGKVDHVLLGGLIANLFLAASGQIPTDYIQSISVTAEVVDTARRLHEEYTDIIHLPEDVAIEKNGTRIECPLNETNGQPIFDIGPNTAQKYSHMLESAQVVFANGPMGYFEKPEFAKGTEQILEAIANSSAISVVGGGHLGAMAESTGIIDKITHISTGGGATMKFLTGEQLVLVEALHAAAKRMSS